MTENDAELAKTVEGTVAVAQLFQWKKLNGFITKNDLKKLGGEGSREFGKNDGLFAESG